jgi:hypothetical protein
MGGMDGELTGDLHGEKLDGVVDGELARDLLGEVFDGDDLDRGGTSEGCLDWAERSRRGDRCGAVRGSRRSDRGGGARGRDNEGDVLVARSHLILKHRELEVQEVRRACGGEARGRVAGTGDRATGKKKVREEAGVAAGR